MSNPYNDTENYFDQYKVQQTEGMSVDELCWNVFSTEDGKKLLDIFKNRFVLTATPGPINESYPYNCVFYEGFREAFRQILGSVQAYQQKRDHEASQAVTNEL